MIACGTKDSADVSYNNDDELGRVQAQHKISACVLTLVVVCRNNKCYKNAIDVSLCNGNGIDSRTLSSVTPWQPAVFQEYSNIQASALASLHKNRRTLSAALIE